MDPTRKNCALLWTALGLLLLPHLSSSAPPGYFVDPAQARAPRPTWVADTTGEFTVSIRREARDSTAAYLLGIAEAVYPPRELLIDLAVANGYEMGPDSAGAALWWSDGIGASRVPYAVTLGAVEHYARLTDLYRGRDFRDAGTSPLFGSSLLYHATTAFRDTFSMNGASYQGVYVTHMRLLWSYDDGTFAPRTDAHRVVVMTREGQVLAVEGDGEAKEKAFLSTHRGIGRQERLLR